MKFNRTVPESVKNGGLEINDKFWFILLVQLHSYDLQKKEMVTLQSIKYPVKQV